MTTTFDAAHRPTSDSAGGAYAHDDDGRLLSMPGYRYAWDSLGRLTTVRDGSGTTISTYTYDALDRLRDVTGGGRTVRHRYVGTTTQLAQLYDVTAGASVRRFVNTPEGELVARFETPTTGRRYYGTNGHGDVTWSSDGSQSVVQTARFDPWGAILAVTGGAMDLGFQGSWRDPATGHYWAVARWYRPALGRFVSEDSLLGEPDNPRSRHLYAYGWGDPVNSWDPDGRQTYAVNKNYEFSKTPDTRFDGMSALPRVGWRVVAYDRSRVYIDHVWMTMVVSNVCNGCSNFVASLKGKVTLSGSRVGSIVPKTQGTCGLLGLWNNPNNRNWARCMGTTTTWPLYARIRFTWTVYWDAPHWVFSTAR